MEMFSLRVRFFPDFLSVLQVNISMMGTEDGESLGLPVILFNYIALLILLFLLFVGRSHYYFLHFKAR